MCGEFGDGVGELAGVGALVAQPLGAVLPGRVRKLSSGIVLRAFLAAKLCRDDDPITFAGPIMRDGAGWRVVLDLPYGRTADEAMDRRGQVASGLDVDERCLFLSRVRGAAGSARRLAAWVADVDPLGVPAGPSPLITAARINFWEPFPFGLDESGEPVGLCLLWSSLLVGAVPRQGKTFAARTVALAAALDPHVRLHVYDLKGSPDWTGFRHVAHRWQLGDTPDPDTGVDPAVRALLDDMRELRADVDHRYRTLRRPPPAVCPEGKLTQELARSKQAGMPLVLVVIDDVQRAFTHREYGAELAEVLEDLVKVAPGAGIMVEAATPKPASGLILALTCGVAASGVGLQALRRRECAAARMTRTREGVGVPAHPKHPWKDLEAVLRSLEAQGWRVTRGKGYYKCYCPPPHARRR